MALQSSDQSTAKTYAEFQVRKPRSPDRLPLNPLQTRHMVNAGGDPSVRSGVTMSTVSSIPGTHRISLPSGPNPYGGQGYPPAVRMPRPYGPVPPVRGPPDRRYPSPPVPEMMVGPSMPEIPAERSTTSLNSMNRPPRTNYGPNFETALTPPATVSLDRQASSVYSDYVPPRRQWPTHAESRGITDGEYPDNNRFHPERGR